MRLSNVLIAILLILMLSFFPSGYSAAEQNFTASSSSSPWLNKVTRTHPHINHHHLHPPMRLHPHQTHQHPRMRTPAGCRSNPWICRERKHRPRAQMRCCRNKCIDVSSNVNHCGLCGVRCPFSWLCCHGTCVDVNISPYNCGKCGNKCPWGILCDYGMCGYSEPDPLPPWRPHPRPRSRSRHPSRRPGSRFLFPPRLRRPWPRYPPKGDNKLPANATNSSSGSC